jgi:hypothetical protein
MSSPERQHPVQISQHCQEPRSCQRSGFTELTVLPLQDGEFENAETVTLTLLADAAYYAVTGPYRNVDDIG